LPERVFAGAAERPQSQDEIGGAVHDAGVRGARQYANKTVLGNRAGRPAVTAMSRKPVVGDLVMDVIGIEERDEQIHVEERHAAHTSSRSSFTRFIVGRAAPGGRGGSSGTPLRVRSAREGVKARRASSERTFPAVLPRSVASSFAAC